MNDPDPEIAVVLTAYAAFARGDIDQAIAGLHPTSSGSSPTSSLTAAAAWPGRGRRLPPGLTIIVVRTRL
jgi:hypothetical protein